MNNLKNPLALRKVLKRYNLTPKNKQKLILLSKCKTTTWLSINRFARKLEYKQSVLDQPRQ